MMTPNFALILSEDGIDLLHRDAERKGWIVLRTVPLDAEDLAFELHKLRDAALAIEGDGFTSKLVLPASQLLYTSVVVEGKKRPKPKIKVALEDQTPYKIEELVYDSVRNGSTDEGRVFQVVAVARETLDEAQAFLAPYALNPVGFTALPTSEQFPREPNLGAVEGSDGFTPEKKPIIVLAPFLEAEESSIEVDEDVSDSAEADVSDSAEAKEIAEPHEEERLEAAAELGSDDQTEASSRQEEDPQSVGALSDEEQSDTREPTDTIEPIGSEALFDWNESDDLSGVRFEWKDKDDAENDGDERDLSTADEASLEIEADHQDADTKNVTIENAAELVNDAELETASLDVETTLDRPLGADADAVAENIADGTVASADESSSTENASEPLEVTIDNAPLKKLDETPISKSMPNLDAALSASEPSVSDESSEALKATVPMLPSELPSGSDESGFATRRRSRTSYVVPPETGDRIEKLAARIGIPGAEPKLTKSKPTIVKADREEPVEKPEAATGDKLAPNVGHRSARAKHLISGQKRKPAPIIPAATVERPELSAKRAAGSQLGRTRVKAPDPIAEFAARQAAAKPEQAGLLRTFGMVLLVGILALGSLMVFSRGLPDWFGSNQLADMEMDQLESEAEGLDVGTTNVGDVADVIPLDTTLPQNDQAEPDPIDLAVNSAITAPEAIAIEPVTPQPAPSNTPVAATDTLEDTQADALTASLDVPESAVMIAPRPDAESAQTAYQESGVWQFMSDLAPLNAPNLPDRISQLSTDPELKFVEIGTLQGSEAYTSGILPQIEQDLPSEPGLRFALDDDGLVIPTPDGAVSPDGVLVIAGPPPVTPSPRPNETDEPILELAANTLDTSPQTEQQLSDLIAPADEIAINPTEATRASTQTAGLDVTALEPVTPQGLPTPTLDDTPPSSGTAPVAASQIRPSQENLPLPPPDPQLAGFKPVQRPTNLAEQLESDVIGGLTRVELAAFRPEPRPLAAQERATQLRAGSVVDDDAISKAVEDALEEIVQEPEPVVEPGPITNSALSSGDVQLLAARRPNARPRALQAVAANIRANRTVTAPETTTASARATGPAVNRSSRVAPTGAVTSTVARAATDDNAISLGRVALVGVFGSATERRALIRMPNGRFKKVTVGDTVDGGRVAAIGESQLKYTKGGRTLTLDMPQG